MGRYAKAGSGGLKTMISPYIYGVKTDQVMAGDKALSVEEHRREWNEILGNVAGAVDILAFQDGQVDYHELYDYLVVNKALAAEAGRRTAGHLYDRYCDYFKIDNPYRKR